jgi:hypothetical protein
LLLAKPRLARAGASGKLGARGITPTVASINVTVKVSLCLNKHSVMKGNKAVGEEIEKEGIVPDVADRAQKMGLMCMTRSVVHKSALLRSSDTIFNSETCLRGTFNFFSVTLV